MRGATEPSVRGSRFRSVRSMVSLGAAVLVCFLAPAAHGDWSAGTQTLSNEHLSLQFSGATVVQLRNANGDHLLFPASRGQNASPAIVQLGGESFALSTLPLGRNRVRATMHVGQRQDSVTFVYDLSGRGTAKVSYTLVGQAVRIDVSVTSLSREPAPCRVRILLDTQVGRNDGSPFYVNGVGLLTRERQWRGESFTTWFGYDQYPNPRIAGHGRFQTPPYRVVMAYWRRVNRLDFDYTPGNELLTQDSSLLAYYDLGTLGRGQNSQTITLYYGSGAPREDQPHLRLSQALKELRGAVQAKYRSDVRTIAAVDSMALTVIADNKSARRAMRDFLVEGIAEGGIKTSELLIHMFVALGTQSPVDVVGGSASVAMSALGMGADAILFGMDQAQSLDYLQKRFMRYARLMDDPPDGYQGFLQVIQPMLAEEVSTESRQSMALIDRLIEDLERGRVRLSEDYPLEQVLDVLDRTQQSLRQSVVRELAIVHLGQSGTVLGVTVVGTLGPYAEQIEAILRLDESGRELKKIGKWVSWGGVIAGATIKVGAAVVTGGSSAVIEMVVLGTATATTAIKIGFSTSGTAVDMSADQIAYVRSVLALRAWHYERDQTRQVIAQTVAGVLRARPTATNGGIRVTDFSVVPDSTREAGHYRGRIALDIAGHSARGVSACVVVPNSQGRGTPLFYSQPIIQTQVDGAMVKEFDLALGELAQSGGAPLRAIAYVTDGLEDVIVRSQAIPRQAHAQSLGEAAPREAAQERSVQSQKIGEDEIAQGQWREYRVVIAHGVGEAYFFLDYEGSKLDLHITDPQGRHSGADYRSGRIEAGIPQSRVASQVGRDIIDIKGPQPGTYTVRVQAISAHRRESFQVHLDTVPRQHRPRIRVLPATVFFAKGDDPDLVNLQVTETSGQVDAGPVTVSNLPQDQWRVNGSLAAGQTRQLEVRRPAQLLRQGIDHIEVLAGGQTTRVLLRPVPDQFRRRAERISDMARAVREARWAALEDAGHSGDLWESSSFGAYADRIDLTTLSDVDVDLVTDRESDDQYTAWPPLGGGVIGTRNQTFVPPPHASSPWVETALYCLVGVSLGLSIAAPLILIIARRRSRE